MGDRPSAGWDCCHNPGQGEGLDNVHLTSKGGMKPASWGLWAMQACPSFLGNNVENKTTTNHYHNQGVNIYYHANICSNPKNIQFYHKFYHKLLPQTTTINGESLSTTTAISVSIQQCFNFTTNFTTHFTKTTICFTTNHYHYPPTHPQCFM